MPKMPLKVEITTAQNVVKNGDYLIVSTTLRNVSGKPQTLRVWACSYNQNWTADKPVVRVEPESCDENYPMDVRLKPNETYERELSVRLQIDTTKPARETITFRLGFKRFHLRSGAIPLMVTVQE